MITKRLILSRRRKKRDAIKKVAGCKSQNNTSDWEIYRPVKLISWMKMAYEETIVRHPISNLVECHRQKEINQLKKGKENNGLT